MKILNAVRGSHMILDKAVGPSVVRLDGFDVGNNALVSDFSIHAQEKHSVVQCFNDHNYIYAFGHNPEGSRFTFEVTLFMQNNCGTGSSLKDSGAVGNALKFYTKNRVSKSKMSVKLNVGKIYCKGPVISMSAQSANPELNLVTFSVECMLLVDQ